MAEWLYALSSALPLTCPVEEVGERFADTDPTEIFWRAIEITVTFVAVLLTIAASTLQRRTQ